MSLILLLATTAVCAQPAAQDDSTATTIDEHYIIDYSDRLSIKFFGIKKSNQIAHRDDYTGRKIEYQPNEDFNVGLGFTYRWLGLDVAFNFPFINDDDEVFGETKRLDIQANVYTRKFVVDFNLQTYKGYYAFNPEDYVVGFDPNNPVYPLRPDMRTTNIGVSAFRVFNTDKFSFRAAFTYNERQVRSSGSWLLGTYFNYFTMNADSTIVPIQVRDAFNPEVDFRGTRWTSFGVSGGYAHTFVYKHKMFLSMALAIGLGPEIRKTPATNGMPEDVESKAGSFIALRAALGYNTERFYTGLAIIAAGSGEGDKKEAFLQRSVNNIRIFIGKRFTPPTL